MVHKLHHYEPGRFNIMELVAASMIDLSIPEIRYNILFLSINPECPE